jgi:hypothetical protein
MGVQGALLAHFLDRAGLEFTWHDIDLPQTAWKACTGAIYPSGSTKFGEDMLCLQRWGQWFIDGVFGNDVLEPALWWFNHKSAPPHGGGYKPSVPSPHGLRHAPMFSYHFNAQRFVEGTRRRFEDRRLTALGVRANDDLPKVYVVTHGWSERQAHAYWGWTRLVELDYDKAIYGTELRPAFYFREGRFIMTYAYPVAGTNLWYAGSHIIKQMPGRTRSLEIEPKYARWRDNFQRLGNGAVRVGAEAGLIEGWRPCARDAAWAQSYQKGPETHIVLRPLWNNGVRHFPQQMSEFCKALPKEITL